MRQYCLVHALKEAQGTWQRVRDHQRLAGAWSHLDRHPWQAQVLIPYPRWRLHSQLRLKMNMSHSQ